MLETDDYILNPLNPAYHADPYPFMAAQRSKASVHWNPIFQAWGVCDYENVKQALSHPHTSANRVESMFARLDADVIEAMAPTRALLKRWALFADGADHQLLRGIMNDAFAPHLVKALKPKIDQLLIDLMKPLKERASFDLIKEIAVPVPAIIIGELLGVPSSDIEWFKQISVDIAGIFNLSSRPDPAFAHRGQKALEDLSAFLKQGIEEKRRNPQQDIMSAVVNRETETGPLELIDILGSLSLMLVAGHETTTNLIGNGTLNLIKHPEAYAAIRENPDLINGAIEEMLRFESPAQISSRILTQDFEIDGQTIEADQRLILFLGAANRDEKVFENPDQFDIHRDPNRHLAFGFGKHFCVGANLARLEGHCYYHALVRELPTLQADLEQINWRPDVSLRGLQELQVFPTV